jgi:hypothetical protein
MNLMNVRLALVRIFVLFFTLLMIVGFILGLALFFHRPEKGANMGLMGIPIIAAVMLLPCAFVIFFTRKRILPARFQMVIRFLAITSAVLSFVLTVLS